MKEKNEKSILKSSKRHGTSSKPLYPGVSDGVPEDFTYDTLEAWKHAHMSHGEILDFVNEKINNS